MLTERGGQLEAKDLNNPGSGWSQGTYCQFLCLLVTGEKEQGWLGFFIKQIAFKELQ